MNKFIVNKNKNKKNKKERHPSLTPSVGVGGVTYIMSNTSKYSFLDYHAHLFSEPLRLCSLTIVFFVFYIQPIMHIIHTICNTHYVTQSFHNDSQECTMNTLIPSYDADIRHRALGIHNLDSIL